MKRSIGKKKKNHKVAQTQSPPVATTAASIDRTPDPLYEYLRENQSKIENIIQKILKKLPQSDGKPVTYGYIFEFNKNFLENAASLAKVSNYTKSLYAFLHTVVFLALRAYTKTDQEIFDIRLNFFNIVEKISEQLTMNEEFKKLNSNIPFYHIYNFLECDKFYSEMFYELFLKNLKCPSGIGVTFIAQIFILQNCFVKIAEHDEKPVFPIVKKSELNVEVIKYSKEMIQIYLKEFSGKSSHLDQRNIVLLNIQALSLVFRRGFDAEDLISNLESLAMKCDMDESARHEAVDKISGIVENNSAEKYCEDFKKLLTIAEKFIPNVSLDKKAWETVKKGLNLMKISLSGAQEGKGFQTLMDSIPDQLDLDQSEKVTDCELKEVPSDLYALLSKHEEEIKNIIHDAGKYTELVVDGKKFECDSVVKEFHEFFISNCYNYSAVKNYVQGLYRFADQFFRALHQKGEKSFETFNYRSKFLHIFAEIIELAAQHKPSFQASYLLMSCHRLNNYIYCDQLHNKAFYNLFKKELAAPAKDFQIFTVQLEVIRGFLAKLREPNPKAKRIAKVIKEMDFPATLMRFLKQAIDSHSQFSGQSGSKHCYDLMETAITAIHKFCEQKNLEHIKDLISSIDAHSKAYSFTENENYAFLRAVLDLFDKISDPEFLEMRKQLQTIAARFVVDKPVTRQTEWTALKRDYVKLMTVTEKPAEDVKAQQPAPVAKAAELDKSAQTGTEEIEELKKPAQIDEQEIQQLKEQKQKLEQKLQNKIEEIKSTKKKAKSQKKAQKSQHQQKVNELKTEITSLTTGNQELRAGYDRLKKTTEVRIREERTRIGQLQDEIKVERHKAKQAAVAYDQVKKEMDESTKKMQEEIKAESKRLQASSEKIIKLQKGLILKLKTDKASLWESYQKGAAQNEELMKRHGELAKEHSIVLTTLQDSERSQEQLGGKNRELEQQLAEERMKVAQLQAQLASLAQTASATMMGDPLTQAGVSVTTDGRLQLTLDLPGGLALGNLAPVPPPIPVVMVASPVTPSTLPPPLTLAAPQSLPAVSQARSNLWNGAPKPAGRGKPAAIVPKPSLNGSVQ